MYIHTQLYQTHCYIGEHNTQGEKEDPNVGISNISWGECTPEIEQEGHGEKGNPRSKGLDETKFPLLAGVEQKERHFIPPALIGTCMYGQQEGHVHTTGINRYMHVRMYSEFSLVCCVLFSKNLVV